MKERSPGQLRTEVEQLRKALGAGGLPRATSEFLAAKLRDTEAALFRAERGQAE